MILKLKTVLVSYSLLGRLLVKKVNALQKDNEIMGYGFVWWCSTFHFRSGGEYRNFMKNASNFRH